MHIETLNLHAVMVFLVGAGVVIMVIGRLAIRPLFRFVGSAASREMFLAFVLLGERRPGPRVRP